jgi:hypothetical protein
MTGLFSKPKMSKPPAPTPPPASDLDDKIEELKKRKKGDEANLMTGGLGLKSTGNLYAHTLGGATSVTGETR